MDNQTWIALQGGINKWHLIANENGEDDGLDNCTLCEEFYHNDCNGCPVSQAVGEEGCDNTPYDQWNENRGPRFPKRVTDEKSKELALDMLNFLKSLLPKE